MLCYSLVIALSRAGGNGMASTAMAAPVFEGEKMASLGSNLRIRYEWSLQAVRHSL